jgi:hypothetical protein
MNALKPEREMKHHWSNGGHKILMGKTAKYLKVCNHCPIVVRLKVDCREFNYKPEGRAFET